MLTHSGTILCIESDEAVVKNRCEVLTRAGYTSVASSTRAAVEILSHRKFDIIVTAGLTEKELNRIISLAGKAEILPIDSFTMGTVLLFLVDERLRQLRQRDL